MKKESHVWAVKTSAEVNMFLAKKLASLSLSLLPGILNDPSVKHNVSSRNRWASFQTKGSVWRKLNWTGTTKLYDFGNSWWVSPSKGNRYNSLPIRHFLRYHLIVSGNPTLKAFRSSTEREPIPTKGCQMVYFHTKNPNLGKFCRVFQWKMLMFGLSYWHLVFLWPFSLVYFMVIWYIFPVLVCCTKKNLATLISIHPTPNSRFAK
jgi:hypothetical protein